MEGIGEISVNEFPWDLTAEIGDIITAERLCPGIYYVCTYGGTQPGTEFYAVEKDTDAISKEAKSYGTIPDNEPDCLLFPYAKERGGWQIVKYEVQRYYMRNGLPTRNLSELQDAAAYGMEIYPEYFGLFFPSQDSPMGTVIRYKALMNGVFWAETDVGDTMIEVSYPLWEDVFSPRALRYSMQPGSKQGEVAEDYRKSLCFRQKGFPLVLFELCQHYSEIRQSKLINYRALMNVLLQDFQEYAFSFNAVEQAGLHDAAGLLLNAVGIETDLQASIDNMVSICPEAGFDYLRF